MLGFITPLLCGLFTTCIVASLHSLLMLVCLEIAERESRNMFFSEDYKLVRKL